MEHETAIQTSESQKRVNIRGSNGSGTDQKATDITERKSNRTRPEHPNDEKTHFYTAKYVLHCLLIVFLVFTILALVIIVFSLKDSKKNDSINRVHSLF